MRLRALVKGLVSGYDGSGDDGGDGWVVAVGAATMTQLRMDDGSAILADADDDGGAVTAAVVVMVVMAMLMEVTERAHGRQGLL